MGRPKRPQTLTSDLAKEILDKHRKAGKADKAGFAAAAKYTETSMQSPRYGDKNLPAGMIAFRFRQPGDTLTGVLGESSGMIGYESWYPIVRDDGSVVHIPGNRRMVKCFRKAKCRFQRITIVYCGRLKTSNGHYEKVYSVTLAPAQEEPMSGAGRELIQQAAAEAKARKAGGK